MPHPPSYRRILHRMDYYNYQHGLVRRHLNQDKGWISHEEHCRRFILNAVDFYKPARVTVLGSGWLLDLPLLEMAERVNKIILTDIIHPPEVISQTSALKNVILTEEDITGGLIEEVWKKAGRRTMFNKLNSLDGIVIPEYQPVEDPGMVISLNILTQLEILPEKFLRRKSKATDEEFISFKREIQEKHIRLLEGHPSVLISDAAEIIMDIKGSQKEKCTILAEVPQGRINDEWVWNFDLMHTDYNRRQSIFKVISRVY